jgi:hypothetical protein
VPTLSTAGLRPFRALTPSLAIAAAIASCHASLHPLQVAEACHCSPSQYCHVRAAAFECLPLPSSCAGTPSCRCLGRPLDACREELGAFTVLEPRPVSACTDCSAEEYCWSDGSSPPMCGVIPARCEETPTCDCFLEARHGLGRLTCDQREGRLVAGPRDAPGPTR